MAAIKWIESKIRIEWSPEQIAAKLQAASALKKKRESWAKKLGLVT